MRVLINGLSMSGPKTGIGHYTTELVRCLREQAVGDEISYFPGPVLRGVKKAWMQIRPHLDRKNAPAGIATLPAKKRPPWRGWGGWALNHLRSYGQHLMKRSFLAEGGYDIYHEPNYIPLPSELPTVSTVCDLSVLCHPEWHPIDRVRYFERHFLPGLERCDHLITISDFSRKEILQTLSFRPDQVTRTYMGVRRGLAPLPPAVVSRRLANLGLPAQYFLFLGTIEPRKNVLSLLRAYCDLPRRIRHRYPLLLVGGWGWNSADVANYLTKHAKEKGVVHLGYVPEQQMPIVYNGARALIFPSHYEGFGLPPIEMMACGGAVLASTAGALAETVGGQAHLVHPYDVDGWRRAMMQVADDEEFRNGLCRGAVEWAQQFTWENCAAQTMQVYRRVVRAEAQPRPLAA